MPTCSEASGLQKTTARNQTMDLCKLIASFFVVFDHAAFPGTLGRVMICLCSFAVPMFFMISGYHNYHASVAQIRRRTRGIFKLLIIGTLFQILGNCIAVEFTHGSTIAYLRSTLPTPKELIRLVVLHVHPIAGHLWFLNALIAVYLVFGLFVRFQDTPNYRPFYQLCAMLGVILFTCGTLPYVSNPDFSFPARNGWVVGLPMFGAGLFLREHQERILSVFSTNKWVLLGVVAAGACFSAAEMLAAGIGMIPFGMYFSIFALMLLMVSHPMITRRPGMVSGLLKHCGSVSTWIYLFHLYFVTKYPLFFQPFLQRLAGEKEPYVYPLFVLLLSILNAIVWETCSTLLKRRRS